MKRIIAFCGARGSGKSTAAELLAGRMPWVKLSFADPLYEMISVVLGEDARQCDKNLPRMELQNKTIGQALQTLGTEWGRGMIGENIWLDCMERRIAYALNRGNRVTIDDLRFRNEYEMLREAGATILRVERPEPFGDPDPRDSQHASERDWPHFEVDAVLNNPSTSRNVLNQELVRVIGSLTKPTP